LIIIALDAGQVARIRAQSAWRVREKMFGLVLAIPGASKRLI